MNNDSIALVQHSWAKVAPFASRAATLFYDRLFTLDPGLKPLFTGDMGAQGAKLMQMIGVAVGKLDEIPVLLPMLRNLGRRHAGYGVKDHHYETVAAALLSTLAKGLGDEFTPEVRAAWIQVYGVIADTMRTAARAHAEA